MGSRARVVGATMVRRAGLIAAVTVLSVVGAGCGADRTVPSQGGAVAPTVTSREGPVAPTVTSPDRLAGYACGPGTDAATAKTIGVYVAVLQQLTGDPHAWLGRVLYVVDRAVPQKWVKDDQAPSRTDNNGAEVPSERRRPTAPRSTSTAPFTDSVKRCLTSGRFPKLPPAIRLVSGVEDPRVAKKQGQGPMAVVADGRVVELEGVPLKGDRLELAANSNGGGGLNAHGGLYIVERRGGTWQVVDIRAQWIA